MNNVAPGLGLMANYKPALDEIISASAVELLFGKSSFFCCQNLDVLDFFGCFYICLARLNDVDISLETKKEVCMALKVIFKLSSLACSNAIQCEGMVSSKITRTKKKYKK